MERFEEISDGNLVWFYREELERVDLAASVKTLIPKAVRRRLMGLGILEYRKGLDKRSGLVLSKMGREILNSYKGNENLESS